MDFILLKAFFLIALSFTGFLCGASLDQSIKQLPARQRIGIKAFSEYAKAADLKNGVIWYGIIGVGAAITSIVTALLTYLHHTKEPYNLPLYLGGICAICHSVCTAIAAPTYHQQKKIEDEGSLKNLFDKFEFIQTVRSTFIVLNHFAFIWALICIL